MGIYNLTFDVLGSFGGEIPKLNIYYGGKKLAVKYAYSSNTPVSLEIDTDGFAYNHSLLRFYFVKGSGADGDSIEVSNIKLDNEALDINNFEEAKGGTVTSDSLVLGKGEYIDYDAQASGDITDTQYVAPQSGAKVQAVITGTTGDDRPLYGTNEAGGDVIDALAGNDKVIAADGNDTVNAGDGNDYVSGGNGDDILNGDAGNDKMYGGSGDDILNGGTGTDKLYGNNGDDTINGGDDNDTLYGNAGQDTLNGDAGDDRVSGGADNDQLFGGAGNDQLFGGDGDDEMHGGDDNDRMLGNAGNDTMHGDAGDDNIDGQEGDDTIYGGSGSDTIDGEEGNDTLLGDGGDDYIIGGQGADILTGGAGNDVMYGGGISSYDQYVVRNSSTYGTSGVWFSEQSQSFYTYITGTANVADAISNANAALLNGASGHLVNITSANENAFINNIVGGSAIWIGASDANVEGQWEWLGGAEGGTYFYDQTTQSALGSNYENWNNNEPNDYGAGEDYAEYRTNDVWNDQQSGNRRYVIEWDADDVIADNSADTLNGGAGNDTLYGGGGNDTLNGGNDDDVLYGQDGDDNLQGDSGNDVLYGQDGDDILDGGAGSDHLFGGTMGVNNIVAIHEGFKVDAAGFAYADGIFGSAGNSNNYASGSHDLSDGQHSNGSLEIVLGGVDSAAVNSMSGGWQYTFTLAEDLVDGVLNFSFRAFETGAGTDRFDANEDLLLGAAIDSTFYSNTGNNDFFRVLAPDNEYDSGWTDISLDIGTIAAGTHTLTLGGLLTRKTFIDEEMTVNFDNVYVGTDIAATENDQLAGGAGQDTLYGSTGDDIFVFEASSAFAQTDEIVNFDITADIIDVSDIISGFSGNISEYINFVDSGANTLVQVDSNGGGNSFATIAQISDITGLDEGLLYGNGQIIV